jgi:hypothetical protein
MPMHNRANQRRGRWNSLKPLRYPRSPEWRGQGGTNSPYPSKPATRFAAAVVNDPGGKSRSRRLW